MPNHPNRRKVYRVEYGGRTEYAPTREAARQAACAMCRAPSDTSERDLIRAWGVTLARVAPAAAPA